MSKKDDVLYLLIIPINLFYYYSHKYLYDQNKKINKINLRL
jgi:hypothetical protein